MRNAAIVVLAAFAMFLVSSVATGQTSGQVARSGGRVVQTRFDRNPVTRWAAAQDGVPTMPVEEVAPLELGPEYAEYPGSGAMHSGVGGGGCANCGSAGPCETCDMPCGGRRWSLWNAGFAATFVRPRYSDNLALTRTDADTSSSSVVESSFDYEADLSPRIWLEWAPAQSWGWRVMWWQLDQDADQILAEAPLSGLGNVAPVGFPDIDISVSAPGESLRADSSIDLYAIDLEGTRRVDFDCWSLMAAGGVRFASIENEYRVIATNAAGTTSGSIEHHRSLEGVGPTFFLEARRPLTRRLQVFSNARASLLFGDGDTTLTAGEDLDLASAFTTTRSSSSDDLLPILESQFGVDWRTAVTPCHDFYVSAALEGQWWGGAGTAAAADADLGLFGVSIGLGLQY